MGRQTFVDGESLSSVRSKINQVLNDGEFYVKGDNTVSFDGYWKLSTKDGVPHVEVYDQDTDTWNGYKLEDLGMLTTDNSTSPTIINEDTTHRFVTDTQISDWNSKVYQSDINDAITALIGGAPEELNTLNELSISIGNDADFAGTITTALNTKQDKTGAFPATQVAQDTTHRFITDAERSYWNSKAHQSDIDTAINNLVDAAPGTLDTLNELAASLGDDPNFATTVTNQIATKLDATAKAADSDLLDGMNASSGAFANTIMSRNANADTAARYFISTAGNDASIDVGAGIVMRNSAVDGTLRTVEKGTFLTWLGDVFDSTSLTSTVTTGVPISLDSGNIKLSVNDGSGTLGIKTGVDSAGATDTYKTTGDGATKIVSDSSTDGEIVIASAIEGTAGGSVTWGKELKITPDKITWDGSDITTALSNINIGGPRHAVQSYGNGIDIDATNVKGNEVLSESGTGADRSINFGLDMVSGNNGGLFLGKNKTAASYWPLYSTLLGSGKALYTNVTDVLTNEPTGLTLFTTTGVDVGAAGNLNGVGTNNIAEFGFQTTHSWEREFLGVKSVVFDIADNWGNTLYMAVRSIEFYKDGVLLPMLPVTDFVSYGNDDVSWSSDHAFNTSLSKVGSRINNSFLIGSTTNKRLQIVFNTPQDFDRIVINNSHNTGASVDEGIKNTKIYTSTDAITNTTYGASISNSELIFDGVIAQHPATDTVDDRGYCGVEWAYNPATGFFMFTHDGCGELSPIHNPTGKKPLFMSTKNLNEVSNHTVYSDKASNGYLLLNGIDPLTVEKDRYNLSAESLILRGITVLNNGGYNYFTWGFVGEDLGHITPGMTGVEGSFACVELTDGGTFDCGMNADEVQSIIIKRISSTGSWNLYNSASGYDRRLLLNDTVIEGVTGAVIQFEGTNITVPSSYTDKCLVIVIGKNGLMPSGKSINIKADSDNPFVASIADGYSADTGQKDYMIAEAADKLLTFTEGDGDYALTVDNLGTYKLESTKPYLAKSVIFDFADNWGSPTYLAVRRIEFYLKGVRYDLSLGDYVAYATTYLSPNYEAQDAFNTTTTLTNTWSNNAWLSAEGVLINQRLSIVLNTPIEVDEIRINNAMSVSSQGIVFHLGTGVKNTKIYVTDESTILSQATYEGYNITNSMFNKIFDGQIRQHVPVDKPDPQKLLIDMPGNPAAFDPDMMKGVKKLRLADVTVLDGSVVDIDLMPVGDKYETPWFPVTTNTKYVLDNLFKTTKVDFDIWWNSEPSDEGMRWITGQYYTPDSGMGGYKRINTSELTIGTGKNYTIYNVDSGDGTQSTTGYYKLTVRRGF